MVDLCLFCQMLYLPVDRELAAPKQERHPPHGHPRDGQLENLLIEVRPVLSPNCFCLRGTEVGIARLALVARDRLMVVLGLAVTLLAVEATQRCLVVLARLVGADWAGILQ